MMMKAIATSCITSEESEEEPDDVEEQDENLISAGLQNATLQSKLPPPPRPSNLQIYKAHFNQDLNLTKLKPVSQLKAILL